MARTTNFNEQTVPVAVCYVTLANDTSHLYLIVTIETILFIPTHHITQLHSHTVKLSMWMQSIQTQHQLCSTLLSIVYRLILFVILKIFFNYYPSKIVLLC